MTLLTVVRMHDTGLWVGAHGIRLKVHHVALPSTLQSPAEQ